MAADIESLIWQMPLFGSLRSADIGFLGDILYHVGIAASFFLFREGEPEDSFSVLLAGEVVKDPPGCGAHNPPACSLHQRGFVPQPTGF